MRRIKNGKVAPVKTPAQKRLLKRNLQRSLRRVQVGLVLGFIMLATSGIYLWHNMRVLSFDTPHTPVEAPLEQGSEPQHLTIQSAGIDVSIQPALIKDGIWQTSQNSATHLFTSARPTEAGNIIIYAHNKKNLFGELKKVKVGDAIAVTTETGATHQYVVRDVKTVKPSDIQEVLPSPNEVLTLYTCTGLLDSQRLVVKAFPA
jgi:LPXTG-site transpeptidase (sortase) family protein